MLNEIEAEVAEENEEKYIANRCIILLKTMKWIRIYLSYLF